MRQEKTFNQTIPHELSLNHWQGHGEYPDYQVKTEFQMRDEFIEVSFYVHKKSENSWQVFEKQHIDYRKNWGLWEKDVVELFIQARDQEGQVIQPYLEFLVSPRNEQFALMTIKPREIMFTPNDLDFKSQSKLEGDMWTIKMTIQNPYDNPASLWGNFHACLGHESSRQYYSAFHQENSKPNFHRPEQFQLLGTL